ncbi:MAG TPA: hypothetical protein VG347_02965 [Verrucomicrobiae bacterium]|nr:hypothetical protein [Verrucomicrobiae bacterium]
MTLDSLVPFFSPAIGLAGFMVVIYQLRRGTKQRELDSLVKVYDINRQLITLGFSNHGLFDIMADAPDADPVLERRYLQLWLNQFSLIFSYMYESIFKRELKDSLTRDVSEFMMMENMQVHWRHHGSFYPVPFQKFVNDIIKNNEPPRTAAQDDLSG